MLYIFKIPVKLSVVPQSFCQNENPVQDQDQEQNHDCTLVFNTRTTFIRLYVEDTHQILFASANYVESYYVHG